MALKVGVTGGIGSGKSTVCNLFKLIGIPVFEADAVAKSLLDSSQEIRNGLTALFGNKVFDSSGKVKRKALAELIFTDDRNLERVNNLIHPHVRKEFDRWAAKQDSVYIIHEAAILFESGFYKMMDFTILVSAPEKTRIERVTKRDSIEAGLVESRIKKQWTDEQKRELASIELVNDNTQLLIPKILEIDKKLKTDGKIW